MPNQFVTLFFLSFAASGLTQYISIHIRIHIGIKQSAANAWNKALGYEFIVYLNRLVTIVVATNGDKTSRRG